MLTQHQMRNIGNGEHPDAPLAYSIQIHYPDLIAPVRALCFARSEEQARMQTKEVLCPMATIGAVELL